MDMERLKSLLNIDAIVSMQDVEGELRRIAKILMNEYCISNGEYIYRPVEIEFYIYDTIEHPDTHVYPRKAHVGELFFHLSGMDICFESSIERGRFGGILIRALAREKVGEEIIISGGPLICKDEVLNTAIEKCSIKLCEKKLTCENPHISPRQGINEDQKIQDAFWNKNYRFIRGDMNIEKPIVRFVDTFAFKATPPKKTQHKRTYSLKYQYKTKK